MRARWDICWQEVSRSSIRFDPWLSTLKRNTASIRGSWNYNLALHLLQPHRYVFKMTTTEDVIKGKYPAKTHAKKVVEYIKNKGGDMTGTLYLEGQKTRMIEVRSYMLLYFALFYATSLSARDFFCTSRNIFFHMETGKRSGSIVISLSEFLNHRCNSHSWAIVSFSHITLSVSLVPYSGLIRAC